MVTQGEDCAPFRISATTLGDLLLKGWDKASDKEALVFPGEADRPEWLQKYGMGRNLRLV